MEIFPISSGDLEELASLYSQLIPHGPDLEKMQTVLTAVNRDPNHIVLGARIGNRLVGSVVGVVCGLLFGKCKPFMVVEDVVVDTSQRRNGIGRRLMAELENLARERDCAYILLLTDADRHEARGFYEAIGYQTEPYKGYRKTLSSNV